MPYVRRSRNRNAPLADPEPSGTPAPVQKALRRAEELRRSKRLQEAKGLLIEALRYGEEVAQVYYRLGNVYYDLKDFEHAEYAYRKAITHDPHHINAHHNLAVVYRRTGRVAESLKLRKKAHALARRHPERIRLTPDQVRHAQGYAKRLLLFALGLMGLFLLFLWWLSSRG